MFCKKAKQLIALSMMTSLASLLSGVFVNIFLWKITSNILHIAIYNLVIFLVSIFVFPLASKISKSHSVTLVYRISIIFQVLYFSSIILSADNAAKYIYLFGMLTGIGTAAGAIATNQLTLQFTQQDNRSKFLSVSGSLNSAAAMISPIISGLIISVFDELTGYYIIFAISIALYIVSFLMLIWFSEKQEKTDFNFFIVFFHCNNSMKRVNATQFIIGIRDGIFLFLINILVFDIVQTESVFGIVTAVSKLIIVAAYYIGGKYINKTNLFKHLKYSMWIMFAAPIPLFFLANQLGVILQILFDSVAVPLVAITLNSLIFNNIEISADNNNLSELLAVKEIWLNLGKAVGVIGFIFLYPILSQWGTYSVLLFINLCYVASYLIFKYNSKSKVISSI